MSADRLTIYRPEVPMPNLFLPEWLEDVLEYAHSIATPKAKLEMPKGLFRIMDRTESQICYTSGEANKQGNLAHAHCIRGSRDYGLICVFIPEALRRMPSATILHEIAHFTSQAGHGAAWMKRYTLLLEHEGFDTKYRVPTIYGEPEVQACHRWNKTPRSEA